MIIPGFEAYDIDTAGVVTRISTGKRMKESTIRINNGKFIYKVVYLCNASGSVTTCPVLRLLALAYHGVPRVHSVAKAIDGDNMHTTADNVMWVPCSKHVKDAWDAGKMANRGRRQSSCTAESIAMVRDTMLAYDAPVSMTELAAELQVPYSVVRYAMVSLRQRGIARKTREGFEVVR
jgi:ribosomal protein S25